MTQDEIFAQLKKTFDAGVIDAAAYEAATKGIAVQTAGLGAIASAQDVASVARHHVVILGESVARINEGKHLSASAGSQMMFADYGNTAVSAIA